MRSIFGRARVTQTVRPLRIARRQFCRRHQRQLGGLPALKTVFQRFGRGVELSQPGRGALGELRAAHGRPRWPSGPKIPRPSRRRPGGFACTAPGNQPGIGGEILFGADVDQGRGVRVPISRESLSADMVVNDDMNAPS